MLGVLFTAKKIWLNNMNLENLFLFIYIYKKTQKIVQNVPHDGNQWDVQANQAGST